MVTLASTTLADITSDKATLLKLASTSGVFAGIHLFIADPSGGELVQVTGLDVDPWVRVKRGSGGSASAPHPSALTVYIGRGDQFYMTDPVGRPPATILVSPYINVINGTVWFAQGDVLPTASANRWWQKQTNVFTQNPLGIRTQTLDPTVSQ